MKEKENWGLGRYNAIFESYAVSHAATHLQSLADANFSPAPFGRLQFSALVDKANSLHRIPPSSYVSDICGLRLFDGIKTYARGEILA